MIDQKNKMESLSVIIDGLIDDFLLSTNTRKLVFSEILKNYSKPDIKEYYNSSQFKNYQTELSDILSGSSYIDSAYNFNTATKRNYITLLSLIVHNITELYHKDIRYMPQVILSGNYYESLLPTDINNSKIIVLYNANTKVVYVLFGCMNLEDNKIIGVHNIYSKKYSCPYLIINGLVTDELNIKGIIFDMVCKQEDTFAMNNNIFIVECRC